MLLSLDLDELKMLSVALSNYNFEILYHGSPLWENSTDYKDLEEKIYKKFKDYKTLEEKIKKEIEYYDTSEQKD